jgi:glycosyltransferase involved in cell wall biosynthesis
MNQASKKVLFLITKSNWGGAQKYVFDLATSLPRETFDVAVAFGGTGTIGAEVGELAQRLQHANVRTVVVKSFARDVSVFNDIRAFFELLFLLRREKPDTVHLNSSKAGGLGSLAAKIVGVKNIIFTVHGLPADEDRTSHARSLISFATRITFSLCTAIIAISKNDFDRINSPKARLIYNGIKAIEFLPRDEARAKLVPEDIARRHEKDLWIVTNAELHPNKNLFAAIDAVAKYNAQHFPKLFYVVISDGELRAQIEQDLTHRHMREQALLLGFVKDAAQYLKAFDIFFLPSKKEGVPYVILEAGLASLPVVASNVGGIPEIIEEGVSGFLRAPDDVEGFSECFHELSVDQTIRDRFGNALAAKVKEKFSFQEMVAKTSALY